MPKYGDLLRKAREQTSQLADEPDSQITIEPDNQITVEPDSQTGAKPDNQITVEPDNQTTVEPDSQTGFKPDNQITVEPEREVNLCVKVPESLRRHWSAEAKRAGITMTEIMVEALTARFGKPANH